MKKLSSIEQATLGRKLAYNDARIKRLESFLTGQPLGTVRFADASITNAKISGLSASKISTGDFSVFIGLGEDGKIKLDSVGNRILIEDVNNNDRVILGKKGTEYVLDISKPGFDVKTTTDPLELAFSSDYNQLKIVLEFSTSLSFSTSESATKSTTIAHGLGYAPTYLAYFLNASESMWYAIPNLPEHLSETQNPTYEAICNVDATNIYISLKKTGSPLNATTHNIKIFLFTGIINMT